tara:strand:- start:8912 stop:9343 length:432 start_codon:yes stop_codon:yes gene_type:complete
MGNVNMSARYVDIEIDKDFEDEIDIKSDIYLDELVESNKKLETENENLRNQMKKTGDELEEIQNELKELKQCLVESKTEWARNIDAFVDDWYEKNCQEVDIGVIDFKFFKIDVLPDFIERHIYKKVIKIVYSFFTESFKPRDD